MSISSAAPMAARRLAPDLRRNQIVQAARALFAERPYVSVTTADVAQAAGVARSLVHHYFGGISGVFLAVVSDGAARSGRRPHRRPRDAAGRAPRLQRRRGAGRNRRKPRDVAGRRRPRPRSRRTCRSARSPSSPSAAASNARWRSTPTSCRTRPRRGWHCARSTRSPPKRRSPGSPAGRRARRSRRCWCGRCAI